MATTVLALFKDAGEAEAAVRALRSAHFESARLGIVHAGDAHVPRFGWYAFIGSVAGTPPCWFTEDAMRFDVGQNRFALPPLLTKSQVTV